MNSETGGVVGKVGGLWQSVYGRSTNTLNRFIPSPAVTRPANPYIAAGLELLAFCGFLGLGRMYAGDIRGGIKAMVIWWITSFIFAAAIILPGILAVIAAIPTLGASLLVWVLFALPPLFAWLGVPVIAAGKLFASLQRSR